MRLFAALGVILALTAGAPPRYATHWLRSRLPDIQITQLSPAGEGLSNNAYVLYKTPFLITAASGTAKPDRLATAVAVTLLEGSGTYCLDTKGSVMIRLSNPDLTEKTRPASLVEGQLDKTLLLPPGQSALIALFQDSGADLDGAFAVVSLRFAIWPVRAGDGDRCDTPPEGFRRWRDSAEGAPRNLVVLDAIDIARAARRH